MSARDTSGSGPQHIHPHNNTMSRNEKFWVDQVTPPPPPPGNDKGWGTTRGGGGTREGGGITIQVQLVTIHDGAENTASQSRVRGDGDTQPFHFICAN